MSTRIGGVVLLTAVVSTIPPSVGAQALGTFRWQLQPFCNLVTLSVHEDGGVYTLDGVDDQCGAAERGGVVGTAFLNPDGSIGLSLTMVGADAAPVVLQARLDPATVSGTWSDSAGNSGPFVFTPGAGTGGGPRPLPPNGIRPASVTAAQLAPGAVGAAQIALSAITASQLAPGAVGTAQLADGSITAAKLAPGAVQVPIIGTCPVGQYLRGVTAAGGVICEPFFVPTLAQLADGSITAAKLAPGAVGAAQLALGAITAAQLTDGSITAAKLAPGAAQVPIAGSCRVGEYLRGVTAAGGVICEPFYVPTLSTTADDPGNVVGRHTSIAIGVDGRPVISHYDQTAAALRVTKCGNAACAAGNVTTTVDNPVNAVGQYTSIAIGVDGRPVISHWDATAGALRVTKCGNPHCTLGNVSTTVDDPANDVGRFTSIAIGADGLPVISHREETAGALRVTKCGNAACTAGNVSTTVDDPATIVGWYTAIAVGADGRPVISHYDATADALRVTKCGNAACTAGNVSTTVDDPANDVGRFTSIAIGADGRPVISYLDFTAGALRVTKCGNAACTAGNVSTTVDNPANAVGQDTSIAIGTDGRPVISHRDETAAALRVTKCGNAACTAGNVSTTVDDPTNAAVGAFTSIAIGADGLPVISHRDNSAGALRVTKCGTQSCS